MHRTRWAHLTSGVVALAMVTFAAGCGGDREPVSRELPTTEAPPIPESPIAARGAVTYLPTCDGAEPRPRAVVLAVLECGDANRSVTAITWSNWGADVATGNGLALLNSCNPTCASGRIARVRAEIRLDRIEELEATARYRRMQVFYERPRPSWVPASETYRLPDTGLVPEG